MVKRLYLTFTDKAEPIEYKSLKDIASRIMIPDNGKTCIRRALIKAEYK